jgi:hypothetical protein
MVIGQWSIVNGLWFVVATVKGEPQSAQPQIAGALGIGRCL